ncbi:LacI family DNA-binding transcriptional regulator [Streptomyces sp. NPDC005708]|uniref:LacI family DNA-binding transcriptional regulator n=1 Tax=Streptomyces sp. NPDC005708 TaxID=3154564 RepID=UPI0033C84D87
MQKTGSDDSGEPAQRRRSRRPTVQDVALRAEVSPMTVSRVLSGGKNVRPQVRERVERAVAELGYYRNENARSLRQVDRSGLIGVIITNIANPYYADMQQGIEEVATAHSWRILVGNSREDVALERQLVADFIGWRVEGLIVVPADPGSSEHLAAETRSGVPIVLASRAVDDLDLDTVLIDDIGGAFEATTRLLQEGHRRIAFLGNQGSLFTGRRRYQGFRQAHEAFKVEPVPELIRTGQQDVRSAEMAMLELLKLTDPPTAVFSANNRNTIGAIRAIESVHRKSLSSGGPAAPAVRLFGFDSFEFADMSPVPLSIVAHDPRDLGRRVASLLFERIDGSVEGLQPRHIELPVILDEGSRSR